MEHIHTLMSLSSFSVRIMKPDVHGRSLGECPDATARTIWFSSRASSRIKGISCSAVGRKTDEGVHANVRPQFENRECGCDGGRVMGARRLRKATTRRSALIRSNWQSWLEGVQLRMLQERVLLEQP